MARFLIHTQPADRSSDRAAAIPDRSEIEADNWMVAVSTSMEAAGITPEQMTKMVCDIDIHGVIAVQVPGTQYTFMITQLDEIREEISSSIEAVSASLPPVPLDATALDATALDAPEPQFSPAFSDRDLDEADLDRIIEQSHRISQASDPQQACNLTLDILLQVVPAESASVLLASPNTQTLRFVSVRGPRSDALVGLQMPWDMGIAGLVLKSGTSLLIREASTAPHHYQAMDQATGYHTRGMLAVPLRTATGVIGVLELLNPFGAIDFEERHQDAATIVAGRLAARLS